MTRRTLSLIIAGWLLGLLTTFVWPAVSTERQTLVIDRRDVVDRLSGRTSNGWIVTSTNVVGDGAIVQLERPRYVAVREQINDAFDDLGNYAQRLRYTVMSSRCGAGRQASSAEVMTTPEPERNGGGNRYAVAWTVKNDCDAPVVINLVTVEAFRLDDSLLFRFDTGAWLWLEAGVVGRGQTSFPGYWSAEHPARVDVRLRYGYTR